MLATKRDQDQNAKEGNQDLYSRYLLNTTKCSKAKQRGNKTKKLGKKSRLAVKMSPFRATNTKGQAKLNNNRFFGGTHQSKKVNHLSFEKIKDEKANVTKQVDKKLNNSQQKQQCKHDINQVNILDCK